MMHNRAMRAKIKKGECIDVSKCTKNALGEYILTSIMQNIAEAGGIDFADAKTEEWIWSIGVGPEGYALAATDGRFYQNPTYKCIWLR